MSIDSRYGISSVCRDCTHSVAEVWGVPDGNAIPEFSSGRRYVPPPTFAEIEITEGDQKREVWVQVYCERMRYPVSFAPFRETCKYHESHAERRERNKAETERKTRAMQTVQQQDQGILNAVRAVLAELQTLNRTLTARDIPKPREPDTRQSNTGDANVKAAPDCDQLTRSGR